MPLLRCSSAQRDYQYTDTTVPSVRRYNRDYSVPLEDSIYGVKKIEKEGKGKVKTYIYMVHVDMLPQCAILECALIVKYLVSLWLKPSY